MPGHKQDAAPLAELTGVRVDRNGVTLVDIPQLSILRSQNTVVFGPNGSGKSSLLKLLMRFYYPSAISEPSLPDDAPKHPSIHQDYPISLDNSLEDDATALAADLEWPGKPTASLQKASLQKASPQKASPQKASPQKASPQKASQGVVKILGSDDWNVWELRQHLGFVSSEIDHHFTSGRSGRLSPLNAVLTGFDSGELELTSECITPERLDAAKRWMDFFGISWESKKQVAWLSTGERRRVMLARAMVLQPEAILLDEPTAGLDLVASRRLLEQLDKMMSSGTQVVLVTHHLEEVLPTFERAIILRGGRIMLDASPEQAFSSENLSVLFDTSVLVEKSSAGWFARLQ